MPQKNILFEVAKWWERSEDFQRGVQDYERAINSKDWFFIRDLFLGFQGIIATDILSKRFTELDPTEKDVSQRAYFQMVQILEFLSDPMKWMKKHKRWKDKYSDLKANNAKK